jgi:hypothetical protein
METIELKLLEKFKALNIIKGRFKGPDVPIEKRSSYKLKRELEKLKGLTPKTTRECHRIRELVAKIHTPKSIDAIYETPQEIWILEVEEKLNPIAIGQVIEYKYLYSRKNPKRKIRLGIICEKAENKKFIKWLEKYYEIKTFVV